MQSSPRLSAGSSSNDDVMRERSAAVEAAASTSAAWDSEPFRATVSESSRFGARVSAESAYSSSSRPAFAPRSSDQTEIALTAKSTALGTRNSDTTRSALDDWKQHRTTKAGHEAKLGGAAEVSRLMLHFQKLDKRDEGKVSADTIYALMQRHRPNSGYDRQRVEHVVRALNKAFGHEDEAAEHEEFASAAPTRQSRKSTASRISWTGSRSTRNTDVGVCFDVFMELMMEKNIEEKVGKLLAPEVTLIQETFSEAGANQMVAHFMHLSTADLGGSSAKWGGNFTSICQQRVKQIAEPFISVLIFLNALLIGVSTDLDWAGFNYVEVVFSFIFTVELVAKVITIRPRNYFFGFDWRWNLFDLFVVTLAVFDSIFIVIGQSQIIPGIAVLRVLRLARFVRLVRLFRNFKELALMISGLVSGLRTLFWAMVLLLAAVYVLAVMLAQTVGKEPDAPNVDNREALFSTVIRSMFTVFRCFADSCANYDGRPLVQQLVDDFGLMFALAYCVVFVLVSFGLFNLVAAIFVENTIQSAKVNDSKIANARHKEDVRVAKKLKQLVTRFTKKAPADPEDITFTGRQSNAAQEDLDRIATALTRAEFEAILSQADVQQLLDELDLSYSDRAGLFDVLDADGDGHVVMSELVTGLLQVRGEARKSDVVATRLAVRSLQRRLAAFEDAASRNQAKISGLVAELQAETLALSAACDVAPSSVTSAFSLSRRTDANGQRLRVDDDARVSTLECLEPLESAPASHRAEPGALLARPADSLEDLAPFRPGRAVFDVPRVAGVRPDHDWSSMAL